MLWEDISIQEYDAWMSDLQSQLEDYESCDDEEGAYVAECDIRNLASAYASQIKRERACQ